MQQGSRWRRPSRRSVLWWALGAIGFVLSVVELDQHYRSGGPGMPLALTAARFVPLLLARRLPYLAAALPLATVAACCSRSHPLRG